MKPFECEFEAEVLAAALQSGWPERTDAGLRAHVESCAICAEVALVTRALDESREELGVRAMVPDSGRVWWQAQLRARREAAQAAGRPITAAQVIALASAMGLLGACFGATSQWFQSSLQWVVLGVRGLNVGAWLPFAASLLAEHGVLILAMAAMVVGIPTAIYLTLLRD